MWVAARRGRNYAAISDCLCKALCSTLRIVGDHDCVICLFVVWLSLSESVFQVDLPFSVLACICGAHDCIVLIFVSKLLYRIAKKVLCNSDAF
jgi:hypothetical protein